MELSFYIANLLQKHNCVVVPELGGFIANYRSATIDSINNRIHPPTKEILFNPNLLNNDGLLGNAIAITQATTYIDALVFIAGHVATWRSELMAGKRVDIEEIGFLFSQNGQITFEQNREVNLLMNAYGLSSIQFVDLSVKKVDSEVKTIQIAEPLVEKAVEKVAELEIKEPTIIKLKPSPETVKLGEVVSDEQVVETSVAQLERRKSGVFKYIAVAAAIPLIFYAYWIPMETDFIDTGKIQLADFNPIKSTPERNYEMRIEEFESTPTVETKSWEDLTSNLSENVNVYNYQFDDELYIPIKLDKTGTKFSTTKSSNETLTTDQSTLFYHLIGGCFSVKSNAERLVIDLKNKGYNASIFDIKGGLYRVSAGDFSDRSTAKQKLAAFKASGNSGWILKK